jgi:hypothetical protein
MCSTLRHGDTLRLSTRALINYPAPEFVLARHPSPAAVTLQGPTPGPRHHITRERHLIYAVLMVHGIALRPLAHRSVIRAYSITPLYNG